MNVDDRSHDDADEIAALRTLSDTLAPFDARTRRRMLEWLVACQAGLPGITLPEMEEMADA